MSKRSPYLNPQTWSVIWNSELLASPLLCPHVLGNADNLMGCLQFGALRIMKGKAKGLAAELKKDL